MKNTEDEIDHAADVLDLDGRNPGAREAGRRAVSNSLNMRATRLGRGNAGAARQAKVAAAAGRAFKAGRIRNKRGGGLTVVGKNPNQTTAPQSKAGARRTANVVARARAKRARAAAKGKASRRPKA